MVAHADLTDTSVLVSETAPTTAPSHVGHVYIENGNNSKCLRVGVAIDSAEDYSLFGFLPLPTAGDPTGTLPSRCMLDLAIDPAANKLYFSTAIGMSSWQPLTAEVSSEAIQAAVTEEYLLQTLAESFEPLLYDPDSQGFIFSPGDEGEVWATVAGIAQWVAPGSVLGGSSSALQDAFSFAYYDASSEVFRFTASPYNDNGKGYLWCSVDGGAPAWESSLSNLDAIEADSVHASTLSGDSLGLQNLSITGSTDNAVCQLSGLSGAPSYFFSFKDRKELRTQTQYLPRIDLIPSSGEVTLDCDLSEVFYLLLNENVSLSLSSTNSLQHMYGSFGSPAFNTSARFRLFVKQNGGDSRTGSAGAGYRLTLPSSMRFPAGTPTAPDYQGDVMMIECNRIDGLWFCTYIKPDPATLDGEGWTT